MTIIPRAPTAVALVLLAACATATSRSAPITSAQHGTGAAPGTAALLDLARRYHVDAITTRRFKYDQFWEAVAPSLASPRLTVADVGQSLQHRILHSVTFGHGPTTVLLWSQMHGDEATATMALADIFAFLADPTPSPLRDTLDQRLTITFVPMLNPDGAEIFRRENAAGIDINRDATRLATPEGRALKGLRDRLTPDFGFNLHDQGARTRAGRNGPQTAIALLAPATDESRAYNAVRTRARQVTAVIVAALAGEIPGRMARYDDTYNPRAFGDHMQAWGTSTVLIESGALPDDPEKQHLRTLNVAAILSALESIATGSYTHADVDAYQALPFNAGGAHDLLVTGGRLVLPGVPPFPADLAFDYDDPLHRQGPRLRDVGDLSTSVAVDTLDATGLFIHPARELLQRGRQGAFLMLDSLSQVSLRRGADDTSAVAHEIR